MDGDIRKQMQGQDQVTKLRARLKDSKLFNEITIRQAYEYLHIVMICLSHFYLYYQVAYLQLNEANNFPVHEMPLF